MNSTMRELEPRELEAVIGGALYGVTATAFRLPAGRPLADGTVLTTPGGAGHPATARRAS
jgi:hypothetical protein